MSKPKQPRRTSFFIWFIAVLCTVITIAVIITGLVIFVGYLIVRPKMPSITVTYTHLDVFDYDQAGLLTTESETTGDNIPEVGERQRESACELLRLGLRPEPLRHGDCEAGGAAVRGQEEQLRRVPLPGRVVTNSTRSRADGHGRLQPQAGQGNVRPQRHGKDAVAGLASRIGQVYAPPELPAPLHSFLAQ
ncbi:unnamed protein product [Thlaspi arvense]|uniref:Uncharacterized protein n=1 Tax=Thlaspi arvense TaxID=13288 RepID=A0AAU9SBP0_THLAR|nr:unnamed protein product [Thlaspi arvense]